MFHVCRSVQILDVPDLLTSSVSIPGSFNLMTLYGKKHGAYKLTQPRKPATLENLWGTDKQCASLLCIKIQEPSSVRLLQPSAP